MPPSDLRPGRRVVEAGEEVLGACLRGNGVGTTVAASDVLLAMYGYWSAVTICPCLRAASIRAMASAGLAPGRLARRLDVRDVDRAAGLAADGDRLLDRVEQAAAFVADVAGVDAAVLGRDLRQGDQSRRSSRRCRGCRSGRSTGPSAVRHALVDQGLHLRQLVGGRRAVGVAHDLAGGRCCAAPGG